MLEDIILTLSSLDVIEKFLGVFWNVRHADWRGARNSGGGAGLATEVLSATVGKSSWRFEIPRGQGLSGADIERIMNQYGITVWNRGVNKHSYFFNVKKRQARWAEYLIMQKGIRVTSKPYDERNSSYQDKHPTDWMPRPWSNRERGPQKNDSIPNRPQSRAVISAGSRKKRIVKEPSQAMQSGDGVNDRKVAASAHKQQHINTGAARKLRRWLEELDSLVEDLLK